MAENLVINGVTYNGVDSIEMTTAEGKKVLYFEGKPINIAQETGDSEDAVMSQAATTKGLNQLSEAIADKAEKFDHTVYGLPVLYLTGDISPIAVSKDNKVTLDYIYGERSGTCTLKGQGASSYAIAQSLGDKGKFNYTIKFDQSFEAYTGWGEHEKYCLKANWIDASQTRNVVTAKLWGQAAKIRSSFPSEWASLPNAGAIDGFPCVIMLNGEFHGLYTFNIPKDGWMFGMVEDTTKTEAIISANRESDAVLFKSPALLDESDYELEFVSDENNSSWAKTALNTCINACINTTGYNLDTTIAQYLDWESAIDYYIFVVFLGGSDMLDKNFLLVTKDGVKLYFSAYDMDTTYGLKWNGSGLRPFNYTISFKECSKTHRVFELIYRFKTDALRSRYKALRSSVLAEENIIGAFEAFAWAIPYPLYFEDVKRWPSVPGSAVNNIDQITRWVHKRLEVVDAWADALPAQETPVEPEEITYSVTNTLTDCTSSNSATSVTENAAYSATITANTGYTLNGATVLITMSGEDITATAYSNGIIYIGAVTGDIVISVSAAESASGYTNLVPTAIDTDGSIYNGVGYKNGYRLSSSGTVKELTGSTVTGFIPVKSGDVVRVWGVGMYSANNLETGNKSSYVCIYDSSFSLLGGKVIAETGNYGNHYNIISLDRDGENGVITLGQLDSLAYIRINTGTSTNERDGADMIVTVNEEITD